MSTTSYSFRFGDTTNPLGKSGKKAKSKSKSKTNNKPNGDPVSNKNAEKLESVLNEIRKEIRSAVKQSGLGMVRSRFDTSDIVQESMLQIWRKLGDDDVANLEFTRGLLAVIAKGHAKKQLRFHTAKKRSISREKTASNPSPTREPDPLENADIREQIGLMLNALNFIHPIRQLIIFRRFFDDASYQDIADEICRPKEWVRQQCLSAQKELRTLLMHHS